MRTFDLELMEITQVVSKFCSESIFIAKSDLEIGVFMDKSKILAMVLTSDQNIFAERLVEHNQAYPVVVF